MGKVRNGAKAVLNPVFRSAAPQTPHSLSRAKVGIRTPPGIAGIRKSNHMGLRNPLPHLRNITTLDYETCFRTPETLAR